MNLIGSRSTLIANVCALVVALAAIPTGIYIVHERLGYYRPQDILAFLLPALVMFIVRNRIFSWFFLVLYIAELSLMFIQARSLYLGTLRPPFGIGEPLGYFQLFFLFSLVCVAIYAVVSLVRFVASQFDSRQ
jgi:hypothetical protein